MQEAAARWTQVALLQRYTFGTEYLQTKLDFCHPRSLLCNALLLRDYVKARHRPYFTADGSTICLSDAYLKEASSCVSCLQARKRLKGQAGVVLRPPPTKAAPGKPAKLPGCRRDSSYNRSVETALLTALFPAHSKSEVQRYLAVL